MAWWENKRVFDKLKLHRSLNGGDYIDGDQCIQMQQSGVYYFFRHGQEVKYDSVMSVIYWSGTAPPFPTLKHVYLIVVEGNPVEIPAQLLAHFAQEQINELSELPE